MALVEAVLHRIVFVYRFGHPLCGFQNVSGVGEAVDTIDSVRPIRVQTIGVAPNLAIAIANARVPIAIVRLVAARLAIVYRPLATE